MMINYNTFIILVALAFYETVTLETLQRIEDEFKLQGKRAEESAELYESSTAGSNCLLPLLNERNRNEQKRTKRIKNEILTNVVSSVRKSLTNAPGGCQQGVFQMIQSDFHKIKKGRSLLEFNKESIKADAYSKVLEKSQRFPRSNRSLEAEEILPPKANGKPLSVNNKVASVIVASMNQSSQQNKNSAQTHSFSWQSVEKGGLLNSEKHFSEKSVYTEHEKILRKKLRSHTRSEVTGNCTDCNSYLDKSMVVTEEGISLLQSSINYLRGNINEVTTNGPKILKENSIKTDYSNKIMKSKIASFPLGSTKIHSTERRAVHSKVLAPNPPQSALKISRSYNAILKPNNRPCTSLKDCGHSLNERCVSWGSMKGCACGRGFAREPKTRRCEGQASMNVSLVLPFEDFHEDLRNPRSDLYEKTEINAKIMMWLLLNEDPRLSEMTARVEVSGFQNGSLIIHYTITLAVGEVLTLIQIVHPVMYHLSQSTLRFKEWMGYAPFDVRNVKFILNDLVNPCALEKDNYCSKNADCYWDEAHPGGYSCSCKEDFVDNSTNIIKYPGEKCNEPCTHEYCGTHGTCQHDENGTRRCSCHSLYSGPHCNIIFESSSNSNGYIYGLAVGAIFVFFCVCGVFRCRKENCQTEDSSENAFDKTPDSGTVISSNPDHRKDVAVAGPSWKKDVAVAGPSWKKDVAVAGPSWKKDVAVAGPSWKKDVAVAGPSQTKDVAVAGPSQKKYVPVARPWRRNAVYGKDEYIEEVATKPTAVGKHDAVAVFAAETDKSDPATMFSSKPGVAEKDGFSSKLLINNKDDFSSNPAINEKDGLTVTFSSKRGISEQDDNTNFVVYDKNDATVILSLKPVFTGKDDAMAMLTGKPAIVDKNNTAETPWDCQGAKHAGTTDDGIVDKHCHIES